MMKQKFCPAVRVNVPLASCEVWHSHFPPPFDGFFSKLNHPEQAAIGDLLGGAVIGDPDTVHHALTGILRTKAADELVLVCDIFDPALRLRSLDIVAEACTA